MASQALDIQHMNEMPMQAGNAVTPMTMIDRALASNATPETLERLLALQERWEANEARKAFDAAMAAAKSEIPVIAKNRKVDFTSSRGRTHYAHEDLAEIARTVDPILALHGLSYRFHPSSEPNQPISVTCIISHRDGHSEKVTLSAGRDESGNKNSLQAIGSTITYLQRYTLKAALGLAASHDDDGRNHDRSVEDDRTLSVEQRDEILHLISDAGMPVDIWCDFYKVEAVQDLNASKFEAAKKKLNATIASRKAEGKNNG